jgi:hypothetical protein
MFTFYPRYGAYYLKNDTIINNILFNANKDGGKIWYTQEQVDSIMIKEIETEKIYELTRETTDDEIIFRTKNEISIS